MNWTNSSKSFKSCQQQKSNSESGHCQAGRLPCIWTSTRPCGIPRPSSSRDGSTWASTSSPIGVKPVVGEKIFLEMYWLDPVTGFVGQSTFDSKVCESEADAEAEGYVKRNKITMADIKPDSHVSECDVDFSTGSPVISFDTVCLGHSNVASSEAYLEDVLPADCIGTSMALARGMGEGNAGLAAQSYIIWLRNSSWDGSSITFAHRGGYYVKPTEVFGPGILY